MTMPFFKKISIIFILFTITICSAETIGRVMKANGEVLIKPIGSGTYSVSVKLGQAISNGDAIRVSEASFAVVIFLDDKSVVKIKENTDFQFVETSNTRSLIIEQGTTLHNVNSKDRKKDYRVETPVSVASVKGTEFSAFHDAVAGVDKFVGKSGNFDVFNSISGMTVNVGAGQKAVSNAMGQLIPAPAEPGDYPEDPEGDSPEEQQEEQQAGLVTLQDIIGTWKDPLEDAPSEEEYTVIKANGNMVDYYYDSNFANCYETFDNVARTIEDLGEGNFKIRHLEKEGDTYEEYNSQIVAVSLLNDELAFTGTDENGPYTQTVYASDILESDFMAALCE